MQAFGVDKTSTQHGQLQKSVDFGFKSVDKKLNGGKEYEDFFLGQTLRLKKFGAEHRVIFRNKQYYLD